MNAELILPVYDERRKRFAALRDRDVLVYWPHGFGDFVHFGAVVPALEPSNRYAIARFGDDFVHLYDEAAGILPRLSGVRAIGDGSAQGARHLGIAWKKIRNGPMRVTMPESLREGPLDVLLYTDYPETEGHGAFPFHTKARALLRALVDDARLAAVDLHRPLPSALRFEAPPELRARVETRLRDLVPVGSHLYAIAPGGHTFPTKSWPADRVAAWLAKLPSFDPAGVALVLDEPTLRARFGDLEVPFAHLLTTLLAAAHAVVGVPTGPLHAAIAMRRSPVVGIWLAHHPDWYDECYRDALHLTGPLVHRKRFDRRRATQTTPLELRARTLPSPDRVPTADDAYDALAALLR